MHPLVTLGALGVGATLLVASAGGSFSFNWHGNNGQWNKHGNNSEPGACEFDTTGSQMVLKADCITDETIFIPEGMTLNGRNRTITAVDPDGGHFTGAIIKNEGTVAHVERVTLRADNLANTCDAGDDRLRGVLFEGASGSIVGVNVSGINQGASGCQEGNSIEVRNSPFDGTHPNTVNVAVTHNVVNDYQKTGIVVNGDVQADVRLNRVGTSATEDNLAANGIQLGFGAYGSVEANLIGGNQWCGPSEFVATAALLYQTGGAVNMTRNIVADNSDVGIYMFGDGIMTEHNLVFDVDRRDADCNQFGYDIGIGNYGTGNTLEKNLVKGFDTAIDGEETGNNVTLRLAAPSTDRDEVDPFF